ncbi:proliferation-associated protein 2G4-like [Macrosteles quadrilineatus]|uniref:proliferation-associated protein 2G4-like n=1 Tax=Macrosteles quadrilineatus TaxID=74068 RepID=UPI0023E2F254|nr:proliferation-associated protein 2G4-like [Macrosteles quadrilineatus]
MSSASSSASQDSEEFEKSIAEDLVVTKYKMAGQIVNRVLRQIVEICKIGASVRNICTSGDKLILEETGKVFKSSGKKVKKGIAFPTCLSVNNCIANFSPLSDQPDYVLNEGDVVKVELGAHIDGFMASTGHTHVIASTPNNKVSGKRADVMLAAHYASQAALKLFKPGNKASQVTDAVQSVAIEFGCNPIKNTGSSRLKQFKIEQAFIQNPTEVDKPELEDFEFSLYDVYNVRICMSSGEGVGRQIGTKETLYRKTDEKYQLKLRASRMFYSEVSHKYGNMPFNLRSFEDYKSAKLGINECVNHKLLEVFPVLYEKPNEYVSHFGFTVLLMPTGPHRITGLLFELDLYESEYKIKNPQLKTLLNTSANQKNRKKKTKTLNQSSTLLGCIS